MAKRINKARAAVERHPGIETHADSESFEQLWLDRTDDRESVRRGEVVELLVVDDDLAALPSSAHLGPALLGCVELLDVRLEPLLERGLGRRLDRGESRADVFRHLPPAARIEARKALPATRDIGLSAWRRQRAFDIRA